MFFETQATAFNGSGGSLTPGFIGSDALVGVNAGGNITSDGFIGGDILTTNGGHIVGNAIGSVERYRRHQRNTGDCRGY